MLKTKTSHSGFTLLEILLVVGIIAILAGIVIIAINPGKQLATVRNTERQFNLNEINKALTQYYIDYSNYPATTPTSLTEICATGASSSPAAGFDCTNLINLSALVPTYLVAIPTDPSGASSTLSFLDHLIPKAYALTGGTGYKVIKNANNKIGLSAAQAELGNTITIGSVPPPSTLGVGLVSHWLMNDNLGTTAVVDSKSANNGTAQQNTSVITTTGQINSALSFNGTSDYVAISQASLPLGNTSRTVSMWLKMTTSSHGALLEYGSYNTGNTKWMSCEVNGSGELQWSRFGNDFGTTGAGVGVGVWHFIVFRYDDSGSGTSNIWVDNVKKSIDQGGHLNTTIDTYNAPAIGAWFPYGYSSPYWFLNGSIDDVRIYNRALTTDEISQLYNGGAGTETQ